MGYSVIPHPYVLTWTGSTAELDTAQDEKEQESKTARAFADRFTDEELDTFDRVQKLVIDKLERREI